MSLTNSAKQDSTESLIGLPSQRPKVGRALSVIVEKGTKGILLALLLGIAGSLAATVVVPHEPASAASIHGSPKSSGMTSQAKKALKKAKRSATKGPTVNPELVKLAAQAVKATKAQEKAELRGKGAPKALVPTKTTGNSYRVRSGNSLSSIAANHNTTVSALAQLNKLGMTTPLRIGQSLRLPAIELRGPKSLPTRLRANPKRLAVRKHTAKWAKANNIPQDLLEATLWQESGFDQSKVSSTGAIGVGQIMPDTAGFIEKELIGVDLNPRVTENNVRMSARYLRYLLKANHSDTTKALHAYYQGMGSIQDNGLYDDTIRYARNVQALRRHFKA
jgi:soluble lytic murein transglycosylase-like protein